MFLKTCGKILFGQLNDGRFVRTFSQNGLTKTEILDDMGRVLLSREKFIQKKLVSGQALEACKKGFPEHTEFSSTTVKKIVNAYEDSNKTLNIDTGKLSTIQYQIDKHLTGISRETKKTNVLMRENAHVSNLYSGGVYESNFDTECCDDMWNQYWQNRKISVGFDEFENVSRNGNFMDTSIMSIKKTEYQGEWNRRIIEYTHKMEDFLEKLKGEEKSSAIYELIRRSKSFGYS